MSIPAEYAMQGPTIYAAPWVRPPNLTASQQAPLQYTCPQCGRPAYRDAYTSVAADGARTEVVLLRCQPGRQGACRRVTRLEPGQEPVPFDPQAPLPEAPAPEAPRTAFGRSQQCAGGCDYEPIEDADGRDWRYRCRKCRRRAQQSTVDARRSTHEDAPPDPDPIPTPPEEEKPMPNPTPFQPTPPETRAKVREMLLAGTPTREIRAKLRVGSSLTAEVAKELREEGTATHRPPRRPNTRSCTDAQARKAVRLALDRGCTYREAAEKSGVPLGSVGRLVAAERARRAEADAEQAPAPPRETAPHGRGGVDHILAASYEICDACGAPTRAGIECRCKTRMVPKGSPDVDAILPAAQVADRLLERHEEVRVAAAPTAPPERFPDLTREQILGGVYASAHALDARREKLMTAARLLEEAL